MATVSERLRPARPGPLGTGACISIVPAWLNVASGPAPVRFIPMKPAPAPIVTYAVLPRPGTEASAALLFSDLLHRRFAGA